MVKYITTSDAVFAACRVLTKFRGCSMGPFCPDSGCREVREVLENVPAADVAPVRHGRWERTEGNPYPSCSECGCESLSRADRPYCQFCGAKMDGKSADYAPAKPYDLLYEEGGPDA